MNRKVMLIVVGLLLVAGTFSAQPAGAARRTYRNSWSYYGGWGYRRSYYPGYGAGLALGTSLGMDLGLIEGAMDGYVYPPPVYVSPYALPEPVYIPYYSYPPSYYSTAPGLPLYTRVYPW